MSNALQRIIFTFLIATAMSFSAGCGGKAPVLHASVLPAAKDLPAFQLAVAGEKPFTNADLQGKWSYLFFGFTQCPDICPTALSVLQTMETQLTAAKESTARQVVFISVDPANDTPAKLKAFLAHFNTKFVGVSGTDAELLALTQLLGAAYQTVTKGTPANAIAHSGVVFVLNPKGQLKALYTPPLQAAAMAADAPILFNNY